MPKNLKTIVHSKLFSYLITGVIFINAILIGFEISMNNEIIQTIQNICLFIFVIEIFLRWIGRNSIKEYVQNGWNWFDIIIVGSAFIPESLFVSFTYISALRLLRIFRVFRLFKVMASMQLMARVLIKSVKSLAQAVVFLLIFMYLYALIGVILFKDKSIITNQNNEIIDPYGTISEAFFSLFRITTGEDWTDLRYNLLNVCDNNIEVNIYHVSWMILSGFLLLNIIVGAIVGNYDEEINKESKQGTEDKLDKLMDKINDLEAKLIDK